MRSVWRRNLSGMRIAGGVSYWVPLLFFCCWLGAFVCIARAAMMRRIPPSLWARDEELSDAARRQRSLLRRAILFIGLAFATVFCSALVR